jgi:hypothetical protein
MPDTHGPRRERGPTNFAEKCEILRRWRCEPLARWELSRSTRGKTRTRRMGWIPSRLVRAALKRPGSVRLENQASDRACRSPASLLQGYTTSKETIMKPEPGRHGRRRASGVQPHARVTCDGLLSSPLIARASDRDDEAGRSAVATLEPTPAETVHLAIDDLWWPFHEEGWQPARPARARHCGQVAFGSKFRSGMTELCGIIGRM